MPHRAHLFSLRIAHALREACFAEPYGAPRFTRDLLAGTLVALVFNQSGFSVDTIGSRFSYTLADGTTGFGIPPQLPQFEWPWLQAGAESPVAGMIHALVVLLGLVALAPLLAYLPMPAMAALLVMVAWGMSEAHKAVHLIKTAPRGDIWVFITCFALTVLFDMVIAITAGIVLAALLFMKEIAAMTHVDDVTAQSDSPLPEHWRAFSISGPLFFAAADRVFGELATRCSGQQHIILSLKEVSLLDAGGLSALEKLIIQCEKNKTELILTDIPKQPLSTLAHANIKPIKGVLRFYLTLDEARRVVVEGH